MTHYAIYPDAPAPTSCTIDLHFPDRENTENFFDQKFKSIAIHKKTQYQPAGCVSKSSEKINFSDEKLVR